MAAIDTYLQQIRSAIYGRDVRSAIANGIEECYQIVQAFDRLDISSYAKRTELEPYITKASADERYLLADRASDFLTPDDVQGTYATIADLERDYVTESAANDRFAEKSQLSNYITIIAADSIYLKIDDAANYATLTDLASYITKTEVETNYVTKTIAEGFATITDLSSFPTMAYTEDTYAKLTDLGYIHSFEYIICPSNAASIPRGVENSQGIVGTMLPSASTMNRIYLISHRNIDENTNDDDKYDEYITIQIDDEYFWEKIGGSSAGETINWDDHTIDLSSYVTFTEANQTFARIESLNGYVTSGDAENLYVKKTDFTEQLAALTGNDGLVTRDELRLYLTIADAEEIYATRSSLLAYVKASDIEGTYATKQYVDTQIVTAPTSENALLMLEIDDIPGTTQNIVYNSSGDVDRIIHVKDGANYRVDSFEFGENTIKETRVLTTGQKLVISINTETSVTTTTYSAS